MMTGILFKLFLAAFFINLIYEISHSFLYKTCLEAPFKKYVYLVVKGALFDGLAITLIYFLVSFIFQKTNIFNNYFHLASFLIISLAFAYFWEIYSIRKGKWEYSRNMPVVFGSGLTPSIQLTLTGFLSLYFIKLIAQ